jgi:hypothetical protein
MANNSFMHHRLGNAAVLSLACLGLAAGCSSSGSAAIPNNAASGAPSAAGSAPGAAPTTAVAAGAFKPACPTVAQIEAAVGGSFPAPKVNSSDGSLLCNYSNPDTGGNVVIIFAAFPGGTPALLQGAIQSEAQAQKVNAVAVPGLGDAAYMYTQNDAGTNSSGVATTLLGVLVGSENIDITAQAAPAQVETIARDILGS